MRRHRQSRAERRSAAYHEAGYTVVGHVVGYRLNLVSIDRRRRELRRHGCWGMSSSSYLGGEETPWETLWVADLAGTIAGDRAARTRGAHQRRDRPQRL